MPHFEDETSLKTDRWGKNPTGPQAGSGARLADFSIRYPITICMIFVSLLALGIISAVKIPLVLLPDISAPFLGVGVPYPNATPAQIQESITKPLEEALSTIQGVQQMSSNSSDDSAWVQLSFGFDKDINVVHSEVREKLDQIRADLPDDVENIWIRNFSTDDIPIIFCALSSTRDLRASYDFLDLKVKKVLERIPGVAEVNLFGVARPQIDVDLCADDLKRYKVRVDQLFGQLRTLATNRSLGRVSNGTTRYDAVSHGKISSIEEIQSFPIGNQGLRMKDIADVTLDTRPPTGGRQLNGNGAIGFEIRKSSDANTVETVNLIRAKLDEIQKDPAMGGIRMRIFHDAGEEITKSLSGLLYAGSIGALLAVVVLIFFLRRWGATLTIALSIPFCIVATVGILYVTGYTLNTLTMMGLMLSAGMLVDNAVVVLESIYQKLEKGVDRVEAARAGTQGVLTAVIAATMTSIIIFVPLIFGEATQFSVFFRNSGAAIIFALLASLFTSLTLIPLAVARVLKVDVHERPRWQQWLIDQTRPTILGIGRVVFRRRAGNADEIEATSPARPSITDRYVQLVQWPLRNRGLVGFLLVPALMGGSIWVLKEKVPDNTPDAQEISSLAVNYEFSENFHYAKIRRDYVMPVEEFLMQNKDRLKIKDVFSNYGNDRAGTDVYFDTDNLSVEEMKGIRETIRKEIPVIAGAKISPGRQRGAENQDWFNASIYGDDPEVLGALASQARGRLLENGEFNQVYTALDQAQEELPIKLDRSLVRKYGISAETVSRFLAIVVRASMVGGYSTPQGEAEVWVRIHPDDMQDIGDLKSLVVGAGPDGEEILLSQVADFGIVKTPARLQREDRRTYTRVSASYTGEKREDGRVAISNVMDSLNYPQGYGWSFGFWTLREDKDNQAFLFNLLLALFMVYFVMASLFESLAHPMAIILSLPFAAVGVAWFLLLTGTPINMIAMIGMLVLIGVVVNNGIVLVDHINNLRREGRPRQQAILEGCRERLRPILMTAATTIVGLIPLAWGDGGLFDMKYFPMARTVMGGLIASTALTPIVLPTYYTPFDDLAVWVKRTWFASDPSRLEPTSEAVGD